MACVIAATAGCSGSITGDRWPEYRVVGHVTDPAGVSVAGAVVWVRSLWGTSCGASMSTAGPFRTNAAGRYRGGFQSGISEFTGCVEVTVEPPAGTRLPVATRSVSGVFHSIDKRDSTVIDVQLTALP
jgi:hypothetical protein